MKRVFAMIVTFMLVACSTVAGIGTDIKGAADWTHDKMSGTKL